MLVPWHIDAAALKRLDRISKSPESRELEYDKLVTSRFNAFKLPSLVGFGILMAFTAIVLGIAALRLVGYLNRRYGASRKSDVTPEAIRKHLLEAPLWGTKHAEVVQMVPGLHRVPGFGRIATLAVPLRGQTIIIGTLVLLNILSLVYYPSSAPGIRYDLPQVSQMQLIRYAADRAGILSTAQVPLIILLAGRNSPVASLTGASYDTLQVYHRWVARIVTIQGLLHSVLYTHFALMRGGAAHFAKTSKDPYYAWGIACTAVLTPMIFFSMRFIREKWYEAFVMVHILLGSLTLVTLYYHLALLSSRYQIYLDCVWASIAFWVFDRLVKYIRMIVLNLNVSGGGPLLSSGEVTVAPGTKGELLSIRIKLAGPCRKLAVKAMPGTNIMLYIPRLQPLSSHPFSVISAGHDANGQAYVDLLVKVCNGITKRMKARALKNGSFRTTMFVEGPYATRTDLEEHEGVLLVTGGVGIAHNLANFIQAISTEAKKGSSEEKKHAPVTRYVELLWFARFSGIYGAVLPYLAEAVKELRATDASQSTVFKLHLCLTGNDDKAARLDDQATLNGEKASDQATLNDSEKQADKDSGKSSPSTSDPALPEQLAGSSDGSSVEINESLQQAFAALAPQVQVEWSYGRVSVTDAVARTQQEAGTSNILVSTCGPPGLIDVGRAAARAAPGTSYHEAPFGW